ncbi:MAG: hypothetical protein C4554_00320 [Dethiobacter sp.]|nr:MAG: hypothetical protein C4554_00320 [Dethiobacter sp.]
MYSINFGFLISCENIPLFVQRLAWFTSLFHTVQLCHCRGLITGQVYPLYWANLLVLLLFSALLFYPPLILMHRRLIK